MLDMLGHLEPEQRARVIDQVIVDGIPVVVTEPLPDSMSFVEWLENNVPSTVTAVIRPLRPKPSQPPPQVSEEPLVASSETPIPPTSPHTSLVQGLTAVFAEQEIMALRKLRQENASPPPVLGSFELQDAPPEATRTPEPIPPAQPTPSPRSDKVTPVAQATPGLTAIFEASEVRQRLDEAKARSTPTRLPNLAERAFEPPRLEETKHQEISESPVFQPRPSDQSTTNPPSAESFLSSELAMPKYELGFEEEPVVRDQPALLQGRAPTLDDAPEDSSFTQIVKPRFAKPSSHEPAMIPPPPPPQRKLSAIWVVVAIVTLVVTVTGVFVMLRIGR
jgi:hypothetical protein